MVVISDASRQLAGILFLAFVTIEAGGLNLVKLSSRSAPVTEFPRSFARAGHAHAGVLVMLALVAQLYVDAVDQSGGVGWLSRSGVAIAAILMPAGFFFSSMGKDRDQPNGFITLVIAGALLLAAGVSSLGIGLLTA